MWRQVRGLKQRKRNVESDYVNILQRRKTSNIAMLNMEGYRDTKMEDVSGMMNLESIDMTVLLETHLRKGQRPKIKMEGTEVFEVRRCDGDNDRKGGGIAVICKKRDGITFSRHFPVINNKDHVYVDKERLWVTMTTAGFKTAVCAIYTGCNSEDDHYGPWNEGIYEVISEEVSNMRARGFRVCLQGDFNAWIGDVLEQGGIPGNNAKITKNGRRFLSFLKDNALVQLNGACRVRGDWSTRVSTGLWTRHGHNNSSSSVLDYAVVSEEHFDSVVDVEIDEKGRLGGGSDHNVVVTRLKDRFLAVSSVSRKAVKLGWDIRDDEDWKGYSMVVEREVQGMIVTKGAEGLSDSVTKIILTGLEEGVGRKKLIDSKGKGHLPKRIVELLKERRRLERVWKEAKVVFADSRRSAPTDSVIVAKENLQEASDQLEAAMVAFRRQRRVPLLLASKKGCKKSRRVFWNYVSRKERGSLEISALQRKATGELVTGPEGVADEVFLYLKDIFNGEGEECREPGSYAEDLEDRGEEDGEQRKQGGGDHNYGVDPEPCAESFSSKGSYYTDPSGFLDADFKPAEVKEMIASLGNGKAAGWDEIPNEALKFAPKSLLHLLVTLYNRVKNSGVVPAAWRKGRLVLVHKKG